MKLNIGLIRVVSSEDINFIEAHGKLIEKYYPSLVVESVGIKNQPEGIHNEYTKSIAIPKIIELAKEFNDKDLIIVSCCDNPGVEELKSILNKPVIGAGTAVATIASSIGDKSGVIGISEKVPEPYVNALGENLIDLGLPKGVNSTLDLMTEEGIKSCIQKGEELKEAGVNSIALACTGFSTIGFAQILEKALKIPVLDPVMCEGLLAHFEYLRRFNR